MNTGMNDWKMIDIPSHKYFDEVSYPCIFNERNTRICEFKYPQFFPRVLTKLFV